MAERINLPLFWSKFGHVLPDGCSDFAWPCELFFPLGLGTFWAEKWGKITKVPSPLRPRNWGKFAPKRGENYAENAMSVIVR